MSLVQRRLAHVITAVCIVIIVVRGWMLRWCCDDAFISFRYAENLTRGHGLVFNPGERVEGYTNFLWTLWLVPASWLNIAPETWTSAWGLIAQAGVVALLTRLHVRMAGTERTIPFAAMAVAVHEDFTVYATSGLETTAFTFFAVAAFVMVIEMRAVGAGLCLAIAMLLRPDGAIFAVAAALWLASQKRFFDAGKLAGVVTIVAVGQAIFRSRYYGELLPNTYYAKSADLSWWAQGARYLYLYILRYPPLALAPFAVLFARKHRGIAIAAFVMGFAHLLWVVKVGGDFMFGRFLVPCTPFLLLAIDAALLENESKVTRFAGAFAVAAIAFLPKSMPAQGLASGIADERAFYTTERTAKADERARIVKPVLQGLGARVAFYGGQTRFIYRAEVETAIEAEAGLTDRAVARQALPRRGRIGHEKHASAQYLVDRRTHLAFGPQARMISGTDDWIPFVSVEIGSAKGQLLHWDESFVRSLRERGATVADYPKTLDAALATDMTPETLRREYERAKHFYFAFVSDPEREKAFLERLR